MSADASLLEITTEPQTQSHWCWAAVSTMAGHSFDIEVGSRPLEQLDIVKFRILKIKTDAQRREKAAEIAASVCKLSNSECDDPSETWLYRINGLQVPAGRVLTKERLIKEITVRKRPVILKWDYSALSDRVIKKKHLPSGHHYLIITGYDPDEDKFRVFDPWKGRTSGSGGHEHWVSYAGYLVPKVNLGLKVFAKHNFDVFSLTSGSGILEKAERSSTDLRTEPPVAQVLLEPLSFDALDDARQIIEHLVAKRVVVTRDRVKVTEPLAVGRIYPIVAISTDQLMKARSGPEKLLAKPLTSSVIATVIGAASGEIFDSILLYHEEDGWKEAEYSNTLVTRLMETVQATHPNRETDPFRSYYLVSIPEQGEFFAAQGIGTSALLATLDNEAKGDLIPAHVALGDVITRIEQTAKRTSPIRRAPRSPRRSSPQRR